MTADPSSQGPFAEFAEPKKSAVEEFKHSLEHDREARKRRWLLLGLLLVGAALGASLGAAMARSPRHQPAAFGLALLGGIAGGLVGWGVAAATWAYLFFQTTTYLKDMKPLGADMVRGNQWDKLTVWLTIWGSLGIACGAAVADGQGLDLFSEITAAGANQPPWQWIGAVTGVLLVIALWSIMPVKRYLVGLLAVLTTAAVVASLLLGQ